MTVRVDNPLVFPAAGGARCDLTSPTAMPQASTFLWNPQTLLRVNCRGFVSAQHVRTGPVRHSRGPNGEAAAFIQPEQPHYAHHPGRFVYVRDLDLGTLFSVPYEPVRKLPASFRFSACSSEASWQVVEDGLQIEWRLALPAEGAVELWALNVSNGGSKPRRLQLCPYFTLSHMGWMNQSAGYRHDLGGIVARSAEPNQKPEDHAQLRVARQCTFLLHDTTPDSWETRLDAFEGEGGLHDPEGLRRELLGRGEALFETAAAALQYTIELAPAEQRSLRFLFGPARSDAEMAALRDTYLADAGFEQAAQRYDAYLETGRGCLEIATPDSYFDRFANHWLPRQVHYHGASNRLSIDPKTGHYLQDAMGMAYLQPEAARRAILKTLGQQEKGGALPQEIRLHDAAEPRPSNPLPRDAHSVWLPLCLRAYLRETGDDALLDEIVPMHKGASRATVYERVTAAMYSLAGNRDERYLGPMGQGAGCGPPDGAGPHDKAVSACLSIATVHALNSWADCCRQHGHPGQAELMQKYADQSRDAVQEFLWAEDRFARGINAADRCFGTREDEQGRLFLGPQSWALLAGLASEDQAEALLAAVEEELETPFGPQILAPAYTQMQEDAGHISQAFPGSAGNGSVHNQAAALFIHALYRHGRADHAWRLLRRMLPGPQAEDVLRRGQLPVFIPDYYRGAVAQHPRTAGRSSQLCNTAAAGWIYRILVEDLFGLRGCPEGLLVRPALPSSWQEAAVTRRFRGAIFDINYVRSGAPAITVDDETLDGDTIQRMSPGQRYRVEVTLPRSAG